MTEPTKNDYVKLADIFGVSLDHCQEVCLYGNDVFTVYCALRLAANLPSKGEIERIIEKYVYESGGGELQQTDVAAKLILERIRRVK